MRKSSIGIIQGKRRSMKPLTIAMQKTLAQNPLTAEEMNYFGVVICDEVQLFAAKTFIKAVDPFPAKYRVGISADHRRKDKKEFLIHDLFGGVAAEISRNELISLGVIVDTEIRVVPTDFQAPWYGRPDDVDELREDVFPNAKKEIDSIGNSRRWRLGRSEQQDSLGGRARSCDERASDRDVSSS